MTRTHIPSEMVQRHGGCERGRPFVRIKDTSQGLEVIAEWPADFTADERADLSRFGIVFRGRTRYYEADL